MIGKIIDKEYNKNIKSKENEEIKDKKRIFRKIYEYLFFMFFKRKIHKRAWKRKIIRRDILKTWGKIIMPRK